MLIGAGALASLIAPNPKLSERERQNRARYDVPAYHWAPDSKGLLFDASGRLWFYNLKTGQASDLTGSASPVSDPKFSPDSRFVSFIRDHDLIVRRVPSGAPVKLTSGECVRLERRGRLGLPRRIGRAQQLLLGPGRPPYRLSPNG